MRSPTCLLENRAYSPENFLNGGAKDFCNTICQKLPWQIGPAMVREAGNSSDHYPDLDRRGSASYAKPGQWNKKS
jgi:hypothetical protein